MFGCQTVLFFMCKRRGSCSSCAKRKGAFTPLLIAWLLQRGALDVSLAPSHVSGPLLTPSQAELASLKTEAGSSIESEAKLAAKTEQVEQLQVRGARMHGSRGQVSKMKG